MKILMNRVSAFLLAAVVALMVTLPAVAADGTINSTIAASAYTITSSFGVDEYVHVYQRTSGANIIYYLYSTSGDVVGVSDLISGIAYSDVTKNITKYGSATKLCAYNTSTTSSVTLKTEYTADDCDGAESKTHVEKHS